MIITFHTWCKQEHCFIVYKMLQGYQGALILCYGLEQDLEATSRQLCMRIHTQGWHDIISQQTL